MYIGQPDQNEKLKAFMIHNREKIKTGKLVSRVELKQLDELFKKAIERNKLELIELKKRD